MGKGVCLELKNNFAWSEDSVLLYTTHGCRVILQSLKAGEFNGFIILNFKGVSCVRSAATDCSPAFDVKPDKAGVSYVAILDSNWDDEAHEKYTYIGTPKYLERKHFVVTNHDVFHEILGESFEEIFISKKDERYDFIESLYLYSSAKIV